MSTHSSGSSVGRGSGLTPHLVPVGMALTPKNLLKRHKLPAAAHLHTPTAPPGLDLSRPLLLYNTYNSTKVRGVSLRPGKDGGLTPVGPAIVIPESYTGWFAIMTSEGQTATHLTTVEQVASSRLSFFLTRYDVPAYTTTLDDAGHVSYQKTVVQSGHVLKLTGVFEDLNAKNTNSGGRGRDAMSVFNCDKFAQCLNYKNEAVFLPFSASGRFYTTAHKTSKNPNHVYLMAHILKNHKLPLTVRLVCGYMPRVPCSFTGVLRLEQAQKEAVILACTMTNEAQATLFEIDVSSNFVLTPVKDPIFPKTPIFLKTVSYCEDEADAWRRQIKVTHHVTEKRSRSLTRSLSDKFVEPLSGVRPLSLSFLSDHDKKKGRERDQSRESRSSQTNKDKSRDKSKEHRFRDFKLRENSVEKTKFTYHDRSNSYNGYPLKDTSLENKKNSDHRKISKQNTYVLQNGKSSKHVEKKAESESSFVTTRSIENMDYSRVIDDISPIPENEEEEEAENQYSEICDYTWRNRNVQRGDAPLSLPNLSYSQSADKVKEKVSRKVSRDINSFSDSSVWNNDPFKRPVRRKNSNSPSETSSYRSSSKASNSSVSREHPLTNSSDDKLRISKKSEVLRAEVLKKDKVNEKYKEKALLKSQTNAISNDEMLEKDKVNEVYIIRVVVKDKEEDKMSTLAKDTSGGYYMKIRGFEVPKEEIGSAVCGDDINGYDSLC
nr:uncharacterized protein LOC123760339 [Procambarus clarkii]XP_045602034.1 uncharacterized protein LOC123760339 [Procambarus clarkii]XP_045602108.1 uncharacterized protein LOC123760339 [Procambarus clarkii]XP_045602183.1 uncharacterized protein LOC123760339 [Procambarus clarkii]XP_045602255.1 uncharacterized protein LOC123760339 [Procambarus clarkii]